VLTSARMPKVSGGPPLMAREIARSPSTSSFCSCPRTVPLVTSPKTIPSVWSVSKASTAPSIVTARGEKGLFQWAVTSSSEGGTFHRHLSPRGGVGGSHPHGETRLREMGHVCASVLRGADVARYVLQVPAHISVHRQLAGCHSELHGDSFGTSKPNAKYCAQKIRRELSTSAHTQDTQ